MVNRFLVVMARRLVTFTPVPTYPESSQAWIIPSSKVYKPAQRRSGLPDARRILVSMRFLGFYSSSSHCRERDDKPCLSIPSGGVRSPASSLSSEGSLPVSPQDCHDASHSGTWIHLGGHAHDPQGSRECVLESSFPEITLGEPMIPPPPPPPAAAAKRPPPAQLDDSPSSSDSNPFIDADLERDATGAVEDEEKPFGSFQWIRALGEGGYAATVAVQETREGTRYTCKRNKDSKGRLLCLKIFVKSVVLKRDLMHGIHRELAAYQALASVRKIEGAAFIMGLDGCLEDKDRMYFAMELMKYDLMAVLTEGKPGKRENKKRWIAQIAAGLDALHSIGILHRDIKPENLMIDWRDNIRIGDFGASYVSPRRERLYAVGRYTDDVLGTWPYIAPEVMVTRGKPRHCRKGYGTAADYWALGCIVFELEAPGAPLLFETEGDLNLYRRWNPDQAQGKSYIGSMKLSQAAESLVLGLIHLDPLLRFGIHDLRRHPYFRRSDSGSCRLTEFDDIEGRALSRTRCEVDSRKDEIAGIDPSLSVFRPSFRAPRGPVKPSSFDNLCWINPHGIWGS